MSNGSGADGQSGGNQGADGQGNQGGQGPQPITINAEILGEYKDSPVFKPFEGKPLAEVFKSFDNAQKLIGGEKLVLPIGKNDTPEYWEQVFDRLGRPKDPTGYKFEKPNLPEGLAYDENLEKAFAAECHKLGILPKQAQGLFAFYNKAVSDTFDEMEKAREGQYEQAQAKIKEIFGAKSDEALDLANRVLKTFGGSPQDIAYIADNYGNDPVLTAMLARIGQQTREDALIKGDKATFDLDAAGANLKKKDILFNKDNPLNAAYLDKKHPRHAEAVEAVLKLNEIITAGK